MWRSRCPERPARARWGFTLVELAVTLLVIALIASSLAIPLATQVQLWRVEAARRQLETAAQALLGFAAAHGRLPCPATAASRGEERFATGGSAADGRCETYHGGFLPAATLGLAPLDAEGFALDPWGGTARNRLRYAVFGGAEVNGVENPLTADEGMRRATLQGLGAAPHYLFICSTGVRADADGCGPAPLQLTRRAAFVVFSAGLNAPLAPPSGGEEARNLDGDAVFVSRDASADPAAPFDDVLHWVTIHLVVHRMVSAGRLP